MCAIALYCWVAPIFFLTKPDGGSIENHYYWIRQLAHFAPYFLCCLVEAFSCSICKCPGFVLGYLSGTKQVLHNSKLIRTKAFPNATNEFWSTFFLLFKLSSLLLKMYLKTKLQGTSCCIIYPAFLYSSKYWFQSTFGKRKVFQWVEFSCSELWGFTVLKQEVIIVFIWQIVWLYCASNPIALHQFTLHTRRVLVCKIHTCRPASHCQGSQVGVMFHQIERRGWGGREERPKLNMSAIGWLGLAEQKSLGLASSCFLLIYKLLIISFIMKLWSASIKRGR